MSGPLVFGTPGGSLAGEKASWAANAGVAEAGRKMEVAIGGYLSRLAERGRFAVFHDLQLPGSRGNLDHLVLGAREVVIIDSKAWRPGFYATIGGTTWRLPGDTPRDSGGKAVPGAKPRLASAFPHADKTWMRDSIELLGRHLRTQGIDRVAVRDRAIVVAGSSRPGEQIRVAVARMPGARLMSKDVFERSAKLLMPRGAADPAAMAVLARLVK